MKSNYKLSYAGKYISSGKVKQGVIPIEFINYIEKHRNNGEARTDFMRRIANGEFKI